MHVGDKMGGEHSIKGYIKDRRIWPLIIIVVALALLDFHYGIHFGIEFVGGTQIPITLEHPVNVTAMSALISALQQRVSTFGLKQITVEGIGDSHVYLTIPSVSPTEINQTIAIIESQGTFDGVVNGKEAVNGSGILKGSIGQLQPVQSNGSTEWQVTFFISQKFCRALRQDASSARQTSRYTCSLTGPHQQSCFSTTRCSGTRALGFRRQNR